MLFKCTIGKETFSTEFCQIMGMYIDKSTGENASLYGATKDSKTLITLNNIHNKYASQHNTNHGVWKDFTFDVPEGTLIIIKVMHKGSSSMFPTVRSILLHARELAPFYQIGVNLTGNDKADFSKAYIEGRFDICYPDHINKLAINSIEDIDDYDVDDFTDVADIKLVEPELAVWKLLSKSMRTDKKSLKITKSDKSIKIGDTILQPKKSKRIIRRRY